MIDPIIVHYVDELPANAERVNTLFYRDHASRVTYSYWRGRWARVTYEADAAHSGELLWAIDHDHLPFRWEKFDG
jgi:hypothetical protein